MPSDSIRSHVSLAILSVASVVLVILALLLYQHVQEISRENGLLQKQVAELQRETEGMRAAILKEGQDAVRREVDSQLATFMSRVEERFREETFERIRTRRVIVADAEGKERIVLGTGRSEFSGDPNTFIKIVSPSSLNPIILSSTDATGCVSVSERAFLCSNEQGQATMSLFPDPYVKGVSQPAVVAVSSQGNSLLGVAGSNKIRGTLGLRSDGLAFSELYNEGGELVYSVQSSRSPYAASYVKVDPATKAWTAASTFSTLKTYWDILTK